MKTIDNTLLSRAAQGNEHAFEQLYRDTCGFVYGTALRVTRNTADADEVTQDVFMKIHKHLSKFEIGTSFKAWVYRITFNTALNACKKRSRDMNKQGDYETAIRTHSAPAEIEGKINHEHREKRIAGLLGMLNPDQRACILLREIEGLNYAEIADALQTNINTVRSRLKRAREALMSYGKEVIPNEL